METCGFYPESEVVTEDGKRFSTHDIKCDRCDLSEKYGVMEVNRKINDGKARYDGRILAASLFVSRKCTEQGENWICPQGRVIPQEGMSTRIHGRLT